MYLSQDSTRIKEVWTAAIKGDKKWKLTLTGDNRNPSKGDISVCYNNTPAVGCDINNMPHCCGMGIVSGIYTYNEHFALEDLVALAEAIGQDNEWTQVVYTTNQNQSDIVKALTNRKWSRIKRFTSMTTENVITVWMKRISTKVTDY